MKEIKNPVSAQRSLESYHNTAIQYIGPSWHTVSIHGTTAETKKTYIATNKAVGHNITNIVRTETNQRATV